MPARALLCLLCGLHVGLASLTATELHVTPAGNDAHPGTAARPVASLQRAQALVRQRLAGDGEDPVTVRIHPGTYRISDPLHFGPDDGGTETASVTWRADPPGSVHISGGKRLSGWKVDGNGMWRLQLRDALAGPIRFRELFVNGERRVRARHPNAGYLRIVAAAPDRRSGFAFGPGDLTAVPDVAGVELVFLHDWSVSRVRLRQIDVASNILTTANPIGAGAPHYAIDHFEPHPRYYTENSESYLDQAGEWFLDERHGIVTYLPLPGERADEVEIVAPHATQLLGVHGKPGQPVRNLHFVGLQFEHCAWSIPDKGYAEGQANFHEPRTAEKGILREVVPPALHFQLAQGCSVRDGTIAHLGGSGLWMGSRCVSNAVVNTVFRDISGNGLLVGEGSGRLVDGRQWWQVAPTEAAAHNVIQDCVIEHCGQQFYGAVGIWVGFTRGTCIRNNELRHLPYTGVSLGWMWNPSPTPSRENLVEGNHIHHVLQTLSDGGGIYTLGRQPGTVLRGNRIHDVSLNAGRAESNGMFLDEGTTGMVIEDNALWNIARSPLRFHKATTNLVRNNLLVTRGDTPPVRYNATEPGDIRLEDNTVARQPTGN